MQFLRLGSLSQARVQLLRNCAPCHRHSPTLPARLLATDDRLKSTSAPTQGADKEHGNLFHPDNIKDLSPVEVARMRVIYGLLKEHVDARQRGGEEVGTQNNPMIDPRSFDFKTLPKLPPELLKHFRQELPPDVAAMSRIVSTLGIWDADTRSGEDAMSREVDHERAAEWAAVDERTMDNREFVQMQRRSFTNPNATFDGEAPLTPMRRRKKTCPLKDERGRVKVDFRSVGLLEAYLSDNKKILPKRKSGLSAKAQRKVARAVKTARTMALLETEPRVKLTYEELLEYERSLQ